MRVDPKAAPKRQPRRRSTARWVTGRRNARLLAVQALFQMEARGQGLEETIAEFVEFRAGDLLEDGTVPEVDLPFFSLLLRSTLDNQVAIDQGTDEALVDSWPIDRIDPTLRALFRAAGAELSLDETPARVAIDEFVEVARAFHPAGPEVALVNAVLDRLARSFQPKEFA